MDTKDIQLNALLEITQAVNDNVSEDDLLRIYKFTLLADLKVQKLALYTEKEGKWVCRVSIGTANDRYEKKLSSKYLTLKGEENISDEDFSDFQRVFPVYHKERLLAVVFLSDGHGENIQNRFLSALTNIILVAIENKLLAHKERQQETYRKELEIAKKVQNFLLPKTLPTEENFQIEAFYLPHHDVGGDYYDYIAIEKNKFLICIGDVSGKGVPAALLMSNFQASLRALIRQTTDLKEIVRELNRSTYLRGNAETFITFFCAIYDFEKEKIEYINCGHNEIILKTKNEIRLLNEGTTILGMLNPLPFIKTETIEKVPSFFLFAYTDGLSEVFNEQDELFDLSRLLKIIRTTKETDLKRIHQQIFDSLHVFKGNRPFHDDITMLSCRVTPRLLKRKR